MEAVCQICNNTFKVRSNCKSWRSYLCGKECRLKQLKARHLANLEKYRITQREYMRRRRDTKAVVILSDEDCARKFKENQEKTRTYMRAYMKKRYQEKRKALLDKEIDNLEL